MKHTFKLAAVSTALVLTYGCEQPSSPAVTEQRPTTATSTLQAAENGSPTAPQANDMRSQTLVTVDGIPITGEMFGIYFAQRMQKTPGAKNTPEMQNQAINEMINMIILSREAEQAGLQNIPSVRMALDLQRNELLSRIALQNHAKQNQPSDEELKKAYDEKFGKQAESEYKARHILVKDEEKAKEIIVELNAGADFAETAKTLSTGPSGKNGGDLGWFEAGQMVKPFSDAVKNLQPNSITAEPVKTQFGWHIIKLEETRAKEPPTFESVRNQLLADANRGILQGYVNGLRENAKIELNESLAKKKPAASQPAESEATE